MSGFYYPVCAAFAGILLASMSGCGVPSGAGDSDSEKSPAGQSKGVDQFDPCSFFDSDELQSWGVSTEPKDFTEVSWEPGCKWPGDSKIVSLQKNAEESVDSYKDSGNWDSYESQEVAGRNAAVAVVDGGSDTGACNVLVDAGGGVAIYQIQNKDEKSVNASCGSLKKIAESTASRLPA